MIIIVNTINNVRFEKMLAILPSIRGRRLGPGKNPLVKSSTAANRITIIIAGP